MMTSLRPVRILLMLGVCLFALAPGSALAHDNLGGDELAMSNLMLIGAILVIVMGVIALIWATRAGQFNNVEESKYRMLDTADEYDPLIFETGRRETSRAKEGADA